MSLYTCITCRVAFSNPEIQREHYKSDWHRYNLKRKVAELPPVTAENFQERVLSQRSQLQPEEANQLYCTACRKSFGTQNAYDNHLKSRKHEVAAQTQQQQVEAAVILKNAKNAEKSGQLANKESTPLTEHQHKDVQNMMKKLEMQPGPATSTKPPTGKRESSKPSGAVHSDESSDDDDEEEEFEDWEDGDPLGLEQCLFCCHLSDALEDNLKHMTEAHSFFIPDIEYLVDLEGLIGYLCEKVGVGNVCLWCNEKGKAFHSVDSVQKHMMDKGHCKILFEGSTLEEYVDFYDYTSSYPDGDDAGEEDSEVSIECVNDEGFQLVLPSGSTVGHRSLMRYYRQNLPPERPKTTKRLLHSVMSHYRALGWTETTMEAASRRARDIRRMYAKRAKYDMQQGVKNNKLQKHFRPQILF